MHIRKILAATISMLTLWCQAEAKNVFSESLDFSEKPVYNIRRYSIENELNSNNVQSVARDKNGTIWVGTNDGLNSFNGYEFKKFVSNPLDSTTICGKIVSDILPFSERYTLFAVTDGRFSVFDHYRNVFVNGKDAQRILPGLDIADEIVYGITFSDDFFYFALLDRVVVYSRESDESFSVRIPSRREFSGAASERIKMKPMIGSTTKIVIMLNSGQIGVLDRITRRIKIVNTMNLKVNDICPLDTNEVAVATDNGLYRYNIRRRSFVKEMSLGDNIINNIAKVDSAAIFWVSHNNRGIMKWEPLENKVTDISNANRFLGTQSMVNEVLCDENGIIWIATSNRGLVKVDTKPSRIETVKIHTDLPSNHVTYDLFVENENSIWAACGKNGVLKINPKTRTSKRLTFEDESIYSVFIRRNGEILFDTWDGIGRYNTATGKIESIDLHHIQSDSLSHTAVNSIAEDCLGNIWIGTQSGLLRYNGARLTFASDSLLRTDYVNSVFEDANGRIWVGTRHGVYMKDVDRSDFAKLEVDRSLQGVTNNTLCFADLGESIVFGTSSGAMVYIKSTGKISAASFNQSFGNTIIYSIVYDDNEALWLSTNSGVCYYDTRTGISYKFNHLDGLTYIGTECQKMQLHDNIIYFGHADNLNTIDVNRVQEIEDTPRVYVTDVLYGQSGSETPLMMENDSTYYAKFLIRASLKINVASSDMTNISRNNFWYSIDGEDPVMLPTSANQILIPGFMPGTSKVTVYTVNGNKIISNKKVIFIRIKPQLWISQAAIIFYFVMIFSVVWLLFDIRFRRINKRMQEMEKQRKTAEMVVSQRNKLMKINQEQTDSINYAKRIQECIMPREAEAQGWFQKLFVYYKPKDIVSGDFYCFYHRNDKTFVVAGDCTGHGVPGAFISILGIDHLYDIIMNHNEDVAGDILTRLHGELHESLFKNNVTNGEFNEGMDVTICVIDHKAMTMDFAGAMNDMYIIRDNEVITYHGDRSSIGTNISFDGEVKIPHYTNMHIECQKGDFFYLFSDGFADQFGGPEQKKFKYRRFKHLLMTIHELPARDQKQIIHQKHEEWKGKNEQTDDMLVIGFQPWN